MSENSYRVAMVHSTDRDLFVVEMMEKRSSKEERRWIMNQLKRNDKFYKCNYPLGYTG